VDLPIINAFAVTTLFTMVLTSLAVVWGINKAVIIAKTH